MCYSEKQQTWHLSRFIRLVEAKRRLMVTSDEPVQGAAGGISSIPAVTSKEGNA